jgi:hypothetical protein
MAKSKLKIAEGAQTGLDTVHKPYKAPETTFKNRIELELIDLNEKTTKLALFLNGDADDVIAMVKDAEGVRLLTVQLDLMRRYAATLKARIALL